MDRESSTAPHSTANEGEKKNRNRATHSKLTADITTKMEREKCIN